MFRVWSVVGALPVALNQLYCPAERLWVAEMEKKQKIENACKSTVELLLINLFVILVSERQELLLAHAIFTVFSKNRYHYQIRV